MPTAGPNFVDVVWCVWLWYGEKPTRIVRIMSEAQWLFCGFLTFMKSIICTRQTVNKAYLFFSQFSSFDITKLCYFMPNTSVEIIEGHEIRYWPFGLATKRPACFGRIHWNLLENYFIEIGEWIYFCPSNDTDFRKVAHRNGNDVLASKFRLLGFYRKGFYSVSMMLKSNA